MIIKINSLNEDQNRSIMTNKQVIIMNEGNTCPIASIRQYNNSKHSLEMGYNGLFEVYTFNKKQILGNPKTLMEALEIVEEHFK